MGGSLEAADAGAAVKEMAVAPVVFAEASAGGGGATKGREVAGAEIETRTAAAAGGEVAGIEVGAQTTAGGGEVGAIKTGAGIPAADISSKAATGGSGVEIEGEIPGRGGAGRGREGAGGVAEAGTPWGSAEERTSLPGKRLLTAPTHNGLHPSISLSPEGAGFPSSGFMSDPKIVFLSKLGLKGYIQAAGKCVTCGGGGDGRMMHRLKHQGVPRHHCSFCILFYNKGMYCSLCFQVYRDSNQLGDPSLWVTCCKCQRLSHLDCVRNHGFPAFSSDFSSYVCPGCSCPNRPSQASISQQVAASESLNVAGFCTGDASDSHLESLELSNKKLRMSSEPNVAGSNTGHSESSASKEMGLDQNKISSAVVLFDQETLAAAQVVAALAAKEATDAKAKALSAAAAAVKAASRAKAALDAAYRAGKEEAKFKLEASRHSAAISGALPSLQGFGTSMVERRKMGVVEIGVGRDDSISQLPHTLASDEEYQRHLQKSTISSPRTCRNAASVHKRRTLSAITAAEASRSVANSVVVLEDAIATPKQQQAVPDCAIMETTRYRPSISVHEAAEQSDEGLQQHVISLARSEGLLSGVLQKSYPGSDEAKDHVGLSTVHEVVEHIHDKLEHTLSDSEAPPTVASQKGAERSYEGLNQHAYLSVNSEAFLTATLQTSVPGSKQALHQGTGNSVDEVAKKNRV